MTFARRAILAAGLSAAFSAWGAGERDVAYLVGTSVPLQAAQSAGDPRIERLLSPDLWDRVRLGFAMPPLSGRLVAANELWYTARPELLRAVLQRARRYLFHIVEEVERRGLPAELALLPLVESGFDPAAVSPAQAAGLWQFIPATGTRYGLSQERHYDARHDVVASTGAALDYLQFLHGMFGDWALALAAYNWGEHAVARAVEQSRARGGDGRFDSLVLPEETRNYVPRLQAVKNLVADPKRFGLELEELPNEPYFRIVLVERALPLAAAAALAGVTLGELASLNPGWKSPQALPARAELLLPVAGAERFGAGYALWLKGAAKNKTPR